MSQFLETLKSRMIDAQKRHQLANQKLQAAQAEFNAATQEFVSWQNAVRVEATKEQSAAAQASEGIPTHPVHEDGGPKVQEVNKTDAVRNLMRNHPGGIRPSDLWMELKGQIGYRPYLYSILKRLTDRGEVVKRRGRYFLKVELHAEKEEAGTTKLIQ